MCAPTAVLMHTGVLASSSSVVTSAMLNQLIGFSIISTVLGIKIAKGLTAFKFRNLGLSRVTILLKRFVGALHTTK